MIEQEHRKVFQLSVAVASFPQNEALEDETCALLLDATRYLNAHGEVRIEPRIVTTREFDTDYHRVLTEWLQVSHDALGMLPPCVPAALGAAAVRWMYGALLLGSVAEGAGRDGALEALIEQCYTMESRVLIVPPRLFIAARDVKLSVPRRVGEAYLTSVRGMTMGAAVDLTGRRDVVFHEFFHILGASDGYCHGASDAYCAGETRCQPNCEDERCRRTLEGCEECWMGAGTGGAGLCARHLREVQSFLASPAAW